MCIKAPLRPLLICRCLQVADSRAFCGVLVRVRRELLPRLMQNAGSIFQHPLQLRHARLQRRCLIGREAGAAGVRAGSGDGMISQIACLAAIKTAPNAHPMATATIQKENSVITSPPPQRRGWLHETPHQMRLALPPTLQATSKFLRLLAQSIALPHWRTLRARFPHARGLFQ